MAAEDDGFDTIVGGDDADDSGEEESIDFESPAYDDESENESEDEKKEERPGRKERRRERGEMHKALQQTREENQRMREQLARLEGFVQSQAQSQQAPPYDPRVAYLEEQNRIYDRVAELQTQEQAELRANPKGLPPERVRYFRNRAAELDLERAQAQQRAMTAMQAPNQQVQERLQFLRSRYPDVMSRRDLVEYADGYVRQQVAKGRQNDVTLTDEAMDATRREFRVGQYAKAAPVDRHMRESRLSLPRGGAPGDREAAPKTVRVGRVERELAQGLYPNESPEKALAKWVKEVGARLPQRRR